MTWQHRWALAAGFLFGAVFTRLVVMAGGGTLSWWPTLTGVGIALALVLWPTRRDDRGAEELEVEFAEWGPPVDRAKE